MMNKLDDAVQTKLFPDFVTQMPYSIWAIEELEVGLQIMRANGIADFMEGKLTSEEMRQWGWDGYMTHRYPRFPAKKLFEKEYHEIFSDLYRAQEAGN